LLSYRIERGIFLRTRKKPEGLTDLIVNLPGASILVDDDFRILDSNSEYDQLRPESTAKYLGQFCHDVLSLEDAESEKTCPEVCPLATAPDHPGWAYSRLLELKRSTSPLKLIDRLLLRCVIDGSEPTNLCLLNNLDSSDPKKASKFNQAIEKFGTVISSDARFDETLTVCFETALTAAAAEGGALLLADSEAEQTVIWHQQNISPDVTQAVRRIIEDSPHFSSSEPLHQPLLAIGTSPKDDSTMYMCAPILADGRIRGAMVMTARGLDIPSTARVLKAVSGQLGTYLQAASSSDQRSPANQMVSRPSTEVRLRIQTLGQFKLTLDGQPVPISRFKRSKALTLMKPVFPR